MTDTPRVYIASLTDYNNSILYGEWMDCDNLSQLESKIEDLLAGSPSTKKYGEIAEEWAIHDYEGFGEITINEHESLETVCDIAKNIIEHGEAFALYYGISTQYDDFEDSYIGCYEDEDDFLEEFMPDAMKKLEAIKLPWGTTLDCYLDTERIVRDLGFSGMTFKRSNGQLYVFN